MAKKKKQQQRKKPESRIVHLDGKTYRVVELPAGDIPKRPKKPPPPRVKLRRLPGSFEQGQ